MPSAAPPQASRGSGRPDAGAGSRPLDGDRLTKDFPLKPGVSIVGHFVLSDVHLPTPDVSRKHAQVIVGPSGVFVVDLESENGVVVNGRKVDLVQLVDGDVPALGKQRLVFHD